MEEALHNRSKLLQNHAIFTSADLAKSCMNVSESLCIGQERV